MKPPSLLLSIATNRLDDNVFFTTVMRLGSYRGRRGFCGCADSMSGRLWPLCRPAQKPVEDLVVGAELTEVVVPASFDANQLVG